MRVARRSGVIAAALLALAAVERYAFVEGWRLQRQNSAIKLGAGPFVGSWDLRLSAMAIPAIVIGLSAAAGLPHLIHRLSPWRSMLLTAMVAASFVLALAASDGWAQILRPVTDPTEYWAGVAKARPASDYLRTFLDRQKFYAVHVRGHPPGFMLILLLLRWVGLASAWFVAALSYFGVALSVVSVGFTVWRVAGRESLRRALPFLGIAPFAVWQGTSADAFFTGVTAAGIALLAIAMTTARRRIEISSAVAGGAVLGGCCFLTFGAPSLAPLVIALAWTTRRIRWLPAALVGVAAVLGVFAWFDYWWIDGLNNTRMFYAAGTAKFRPAFYFFFANIAVLAIAVGPATLAGFTRLRRGGSVALVVGALACVFLANASGLSKAETERIWLLYMPWLAVAAGALATTVRRQQLWLASQVIAAVILQAALVSKW